MDQSHALHSPASSEQTQSLWPIIGSRTGFYNNIYNDDMTTVTSTAQRIKQQANSNCLLYTQYYNNTFTF